VQLKPEGDGTLLSYTADAQVGGKIAQIGARLIDATAKKLADEFFSRFAEVVAQPVAAAGPVATPPPAVAANGAPRPALAPTIWIPALIVAVGTLLWLLTR
jgi:hypothetical protein